MSLPGSDKYRVEPEARASNTAIDRANEVSIIAVLKDFLDVEVPDSGDRSWKDWCPFGFEHPDGGRDRGWRVYPSTNSSFCFVMHGGMSPVRLVAIRKDVHPRRAADLILDHYGLLKPRHWRERYNELVASHSRARRSNTSPTALLEALHAALSREPLYFEKQFDGDFNTLLESKLDGLDTLLSDAADDDEIRAWYVSTRDELAGALR